MKKREFIRNVGLLSASAVVIPSSGLKNLLEITNTYKQDFSTGVGLNKKPGEMQNAVKVSLKDKFFGCIAGCHIGSSMGAPVEGNSWSRIEKEHGTLEKLLPYHHYGNSNNWMREPGTTEDGVERQKLIITAIIEKQDRINAEDLRRS